MHVNDLLRLGVIRSTKDSPLGLSPHRSPAVIIVKHSEQVRGKSRMIFDYRRLNDNTYRDGYNIPNLQDLIHLTKGAKVFSKFDCKSGFWQLKMEESSIPWTTFTCPYGHYEWLVMPFGLKNAPAQFQKKMDSIFNPYKDFVLAYIDDILVYSKNKTDHVLHLKKTLALFEEHGIIISKTKIELMKERINFLGVIIGEGQIEMQPHIAEKTLGLPDNYHNNLKGLQRFLGLLNYARQFIKGYGRIADPLYSKTTTTGVKEFNKQDEERVKELKDLVRNIPKLFIPVSTDFLIIISDGSLEGWGAILECIPSEFSTEKPRLVAYNSEKYKEENVKSSIDQEILAVVYALDSFKAFIIDKNRIKLGTDC